METKKKYTKHLDEIKKKIEILKEKLEKHQIEFEKNPSNWGYVGDVSYINEKLEEVITFMT
jgi:hypothetical protein